MSFSENCISCGKIRVLQKPSKKGMCRSCSAKIASSIFLTRGWNKVNQDVKDGIKKNGFSGKKHSDETKELLKNIDKSYTKTDEFRRNMSLVTSGENNPMYGKSVYDVWIKKYGKDIADLKTIEWKKKISIKNSGKNNPMYGKPSPTGSGNGWSGWYKEWYFRSILELSYMVLVIERFDLNWCSADLNQYIVKYIDALNNERTYRADFIINDKYMIEIKPIRLANSPNNILKAAAARVFCNDNNLKYKITRCSTLNYTEIQKLKESGDLIFTNKYEHEFKQYKPIT